MYRAPFEQWLSFTEGTPAADTTGYSNRIVSIDFHGNAATVKTDLEWPNVHYVDYLLLLKVDGQWRIANKIWYQEPCGEAAKTG